MEIRPEVFWLIMGTAVVTFLPRVLPLAVFSRIELPDWAHRFLSYIPVAVMAALVAQELLTTNDQFIPVLHNEKLLAFIPTFLIALLTRSLLGTVVAGIISMIAVNFAF